MATFLKSPIHQIKNLAKISHYTVLVKCKVDVFFGLGVGAVPTSGGLFVMYLFLSEPTLLANDPLTVHHALTAHTCGFQCASDADICSYLDVGAKCV